MSDMSMHAHNAMHGKQTHYLGHNMEGTSLFGFVVLVVIVFMFLFFFKPDYVLRKKGCETTDEVDCMKALLTAIVISLVICFLIWLVVYLFTC